jgi:hypothetical protein
VLYLVGLTVVFGVLTTIVADGPARPVPYTEFKRMVRSDQIAAVTIARAVSGAQTVPAEGAQASATGRVCVTAVGVA